MTLNDIELRNDRYFYVISPKAVAFGATTLKYRSIMSVTNNVAERF